VGSLIGRAAQLEEIGEALDAAVEGRSARLLLVGEAGIGKTSLLAAAADAAAARGLRVLEGSAIASGAGMPFLPLIAPLRASLSGSAVTQHGVHPAAIRAVKRLLDGSSVGLPAHATTPSEPDAAAAARLVDAIVEVFAATPTALLVDDVHWADASTLTVLEHAAHRARADQIAIILAARDDEPRWLRGIPFADARRYRLVRIPPLSSAEVQAQLAGLAGHRVPEARAAWDCPHLGG
jgi:predicted ATPase